MEIAQLKRTIQRKTADGTLPSCEGEAGNKLVAFANFLAKYHDGFFSSKSIVEDSLHYPNHISGIRAILQLL